MALVDNLKFSFEMNETSGDIVDAHGGHIGTQIGGTIPLTIAGRDLEANDLEYFEVPAHEDFAGGDVAWTAYIECTPESLANFPFLMGKWGSTPSENEWILWYYQDIARFAINKMSGETEVATYYSNFTSASVGTRYHVFAWHDPIANLIGISVNDGPAITTSTSTGMNSGPLPLRIGERWDGGLRRARFWKRVLTSNERTELFNGHAGMSYEHLAGLLEEPAAGTPPETTPSRLEVIFDGEVIKSTDSLLFECECDSARPDDSGEIVAANEPRYGLPRAIGATIRDADFETVNSTPNITNEVIGHSMTGVDADGETPLGIFFGADSALRFFRDNLTTPVNTRLATSFNRTVRTGEVRHDLLTGSADMDPTIYHSYDSEQSAWNTVAYGIIISVANQQSATTDVVTGDLSVIVYDVPEGGEIGDAAGIRLEHQILGLAGNEGENGGHRWMTSIRPENPEGDTGPVLSLWVAISNYRSGGGGVAEVCRLTRSSESSPWVFGAWKRFEIPECRHVHSAGVVFLRNPDDSLSRIEVIAFYGDLDPSVHVNSGYMRFWCDDPDNYGSADWDENREFYGKNVDDGDPGGIIGDQPVCAAPGPDDRSLIVSSDLWNYSIGKVTVPEDTTKHPQTTLLHGRFSTDGLWVHRSRHNGPWIGFSTYSSDAEIGRCVYSWDGNNFHVLNGTAADGLFWGDSILRMDFNSIQLAELPPAPRVVSPLRVGPGGANLLRTDLPSSGGALNSHGVGVAGTFPNWTFPDWDSITVPVPPTQARPIHIDAPASRASATYLDDSTLCGRVLGGHTLVSRHYILPHPRGIAHVHQVPQGSPASAPLTSAGGRFVSNDQWHPLVLDSAPVHDVTFGSLYRWNAAGSNGNQWTDNKLLWTAAVVYERDTLPGYNVAPGTTGGNELPRIYGYQCGDEWTHYLMLQCPHDAWYSATTFHQTEIPLFTLGRVANNVYVYADLSAQAIKARVTVDSVVAGTITVSHADIKIIPESHIRVGIAQRAGAIEVSVSIDGCEPLESSLAATVLDENPSEVRFGKPDFRSMNFADAANIDVLGLVVYTDAGHDSDERTAILMTDGTEEEESDSTRTLSYVLIDPTRGISKDASALRTVREISGRIDVTSPINIIKELPAQKKMTGTDADGSPIVEEGTEVPIEDRTLNIKIGAAFAGQSRPHTKEIE